MSAISKLLVGYKASCNLSSCIESITPNFMVTFIAGVRDAAVVTGAVAAAAAVAVAAANVYRKRWSDEANGLHVCVKMA